MPDTDFRELLGNRMEDGFVVCVGLDSDPTQLPEAARECGWRTDGKRMLWFNKEIVEAAAETALAFKPNIAFYASHGPDGLAGLKDIIKFIHQRYPQIPVILDAKRADIGSTNHGYVQEAFEYFDADAITLHPFLGAEALRPFLDHERKGLFILCRTSNPGAGEFQDLRVEVDIGSMPLYQVVARRVATDWNENDNCGLVVGATYPDELAEVRQLVGDMPILIPGIGTQGGDLEATVKAGANNKGQGMIINSSRGIIFASNGPDFAQAAHLATQKLHDQIRAVLTAITVKGG